MKRVKVCENVKVNSEIDFYTERVNLRAVGAKVGVQSNPHCIRPTILPSEKFYIFFCPLKSFLVAQSNLNKWCGATPPSGMVLFEIKV